MKFTQIEITQSDLNFEREILIQPFGFRGGYLSELWQVIVGMRSGSGTSTIGLHTQSVLYCDADLFASQPEASSNAMMYLLTNQALQLAQEIPFETPINLLDDVFPELLKAGKTITGRPNLNHNFIYNSLVALDNAAWLLFAAENNLNDFEGMVQALDKNIFTDRQSKIGVMYQVPYGMKVEDIKKAVELGYFVIKIKLGQPGTEAEMLKKDQERLEEIHQAIRHLDPPESSGLSQIKYTLDANGRYRNKESILTLLDHCRKIGMWDQILVFEEPLAANDNLVVSDLGLTIAADESVQSEKEAIIRIQQGYGALVLKNIAKTLSETLKLARLAKAHQIPCICADLTVNPVLVNWNKNVAAHLPAFPGLGQMGLIETNGDMNYRNWERMKSYLPNPEASYNQVKGGVFELNQDFYQRSGGIFEPSAHYQAILKDF